ncbi:hypothetical protein LX87_00424 [Larkinella arboricola]|uniref:Uncharacterized protein n=1 Tax=Larkinella arboricola TaxID=643671 RepID=A0A327X876_LARAB|nr:hypothetical protein LX87_00424 [Larkinella arboricola]
MGLLADSCKIGCRAAHHHQCPNSNFMTGLRAILTNQKPGKDYKTLWRFQDKAD